MRQNLERDRRIVEQIDLGRPMTDIAIAARISVGRVSQIYSRAKCPVAVLTSVPATQWMMFVEEAHKRKTDPRHLAGIVLARAIAQGLVPHLLGGDA